jgi:hypothetical protein
LLSGTTNIIIISAIVPQRALSEAIPIAKARGIIQIVMSGPERISGVAIVTEIPVTFTRVMFAPKIHAKPHRSSTIFNARR